MVTKVAGDPESIFWEWLLRGPGRSALWSACWQNYFRRKEEHSPQWRERDLYCEDEENCLRKKSHRNKRREDAKKLKPELGKALKEEEMFIS